MCLQAPHSGRRPAGHGQVRSRSVTARGSRPMSRPRRGSRARGMTVVGPASASRPRSRSERFSAREGRPGAAQAQAYTALNVERNNAEPLTLEIQEHVDRRSDRSLSVRLVPV